jgi:hypothetical protein
MRIPKASEISDVGLIVASDGERFAIIRFVDGDVQLMPVDEFHHQAHRNRDWSLHLEELEADADRALADRERDTA